MKYRERTGATQRIREHHGVPIGDGGLKDLANRGRGPKYSIINGRALYTDDDIDAWVAEQSARPPQKRPRLQRAADPGLATSVPVLLQRAQMKSSRKPRRRAVTKPSPRRVRK